ncbi:unnamed protein product [Rotaria sp. Silwood1]|nr:unnamed protein product [Rotaria sp. Silwood1]CAF3334530.1 unnamed protein product [Rotaria sp. Silwood1]CAF3355658.1 unnamed protein product [Rotaria sp. Silwood1]CAF4636088.1 unnamed protein product [Rotaria sp. Silwood1]CAF4749768.1 unnamed protein product [Rotaria sp. Silwood1]
MSTSTDDLPQRLVSISFQLNRIVPIFQLILGTFGNIMNIFIFTRRSLRTNPCSHYFLASSINNLFVLYVALLTRLLSSGWKIDPSNSNIILCKLRIFFVYSSLCLIQWFVVLASIDRFFSTCHTIQYRQFSSLKIARRAVALIILIIALAHFHTLIWWTVDYIDTDLYCNIFISEYELAFQIFFLTFSCMLPIILMIIFGMLMILNVRKLHIQIAAQNNGVRSDRSRSKDRQLVTMLLVQVIAMICCTAPFATVNIFDMIVRYMDKIIYNPKIKQFFDNICRLILYLNPMIGFYIYTLFSRAFRTETKRLIKNGFQYVYEKSGLQRCFLTHQQNQTTVSNQPALQWVKKVRSNQNPIKY